MLRGKNALAQDLKKRTGNEKDMLYKTLVIIDEAHKLFEEGGSAQERPNVDAILESFQNSYKNSGKDSVKVLLMSATPYSDNPMDFMKLMNLIKREEEQIPTKFEDFCEVFKLNDKGHFNKRSKAKFINQIDGYVSYLDRGKDKTTFAQPILYDIDVPINTKGNGEKDDILFEIEHLKSSIESADILSKTTKSKISLLKKNLTKCKKRVEKEKEKCKGNKDCLSRVNERECGILNSTIREEETTINALKNGKRFDKERIAELKKDIRSLSKTDQDTQLSKLSECISSIPNELKIEGDFRKQTPFLEVSLPVYRILGHGDEKFVNFDKRLTVPQDTYIVTIAQTGRFAWMHNVCKMANIADHDMLKQPWNHKRQLEKICGCRIHIYYPGDKMPSVTTSLLLDFDNKTKFAKSGVYLGPNIPELDPDLFNLGDAYCIGDLKSSEGMTDRVKRDVYKGNVFKRIGEKQTFKLEEIIKDMGKGVYFFLGCRIWNSRVNSFDHRKVTKESYVQQKKRRA
jgi:hypothetical protein